MNVPGIKGIKLIIRISLIYDMFISLKKCLVTATTSVFLPTYIIKWWVIVTYS